MIVALGVFILSFDALLVRLAGTSAFNVVFWRGLFTFTSLALLLVLGGAAARLTLRPIWGLSLAGLVAGAGLVLFPLSITHTETANTVVILTAAPFFAALFSRLFLKERIAARTWIAILVVAIGIATIFSGSLSTDGRFGDVIALIAAINFGINMTILRAMPGISRIAVTCLSGIVACLICAPFATPLGLPTESLGWLALSGLLQMPAAMVLISIGTRFLPAPEVSLLLLIETLLAPVWVYLVFTEAPSEATIYGGAMILITLFVHSWLGLRNRERAGR
ncbi:MAG: DMT family transporter [Proteobacteria bacterium]|nr:MAG: DMT family transporter [Pseudomonadota bacterium]